MPSNAASLPRVANPRLGIRSKRRERPWTTVVFRVSRWLHVYLSTALFGLLAFFCLTGIFLNHGWYGGKSKSFVETVKLEPELLHRLQEPTPNPAVLTDWVEHRLGWRAPGSIDMDLELGEMVLGYDVPAGYGTVSFYLDTATVEIERSSGSTIGILNDLHKGRHSGAVWSWIIDGSAVFMLLFAVTGLILLLQNKRFRRPGLWATFLGLLTPFLAYLCFVPSVSP